MVINNSYVNNINRIRDSQTTTSVQKSKQDQGGFGKILDDKISQKSELKFSKHAELRLQSRNIQLSDIQKDKINQAVDRANEKGVKDSLVIMDNLAFVVSVKNRTVITAVNNNELKENVFTNIDGAVFA